MHRFRRGVGRIVAAVAEPHALRVVPYYHTGAEQVQPTSAESTSFFSYPKLGTPIHVIFGAPLDLAPLLALRERGARGVWGCSLTVTSNMKPARAPSIENTTFTF